MLLEAAKFGVAQSLHGIFLVSLVIALLSIVAVLFLREIPLRGGARPTVSVAPESAVELPEEGQIAVSL